MARKGPAYARGDSGARPQGAYRQPRSLCPRQVRPAERMDGRPSDEGRRPLERCGRRHRELRRLCRAHGQARGEPLAEMESACAVKRDGAWGLSLLIIATEPKYIFCYRHFWLVDDR